jgi:glucose/arabinose dehydrogenase
MRAPAAVLTVVLAVVPAACSSGGGSSAPSVSPPVSPSVSSSSPASSSAPGSRSATPSRPAGPPRLALVGRFDSPIHLASPPGDERLFVVEQAGRIRVVRKGRTLPAPFLDITGQVGSGGERGLLSVAFAPDYATSGRFYVDYTNRAGDTRVVEYRVSANPDRADPATRRELLAVDQPYSNHNGGLLLFDKAGMLLIGLGDGGSGGDPDNRAQNVADLLGKVLRIDPHPSGGRPYGIPADNPFRSAAGARPEVWAYGLRNPWRFSFDGDTFYLADVGQNRVEEVNAVPPGRQAGANYGWRPFEGRDHYTQERPVHPDRVVTPVHTYTHDGGRCSVTGGVVYRGSVRALQGRYLFGDYCTGEIWSFPAGTADRPAVVAFPVRGGHPASFGVDSAGEVYVVSQDGEVWRIAD